MRARVVQRGFVALAMPVRTFSITKNTTSYQFGTCQHFFYFVFAETEKVTQTGTGSEDLPADHHDDRKIVWLGAHEYSAQETRGL